MTTTWSTAQLVDTIGDIGTGLAAFPTAAAAYAGLVQLAVSAVPGVEAASVTRADGSGFRTVASTASLSGKGDQLQYDVGTGPCLDALSARTTYVVADLAKETRWQPFAGRASAELGIASMMSQWLRTRDAADPALGLNFYSSTEDAFGEDSAVTGALVATLGATSIIGAVAYERVTNLQHALDTNRAIGIAIGVLMTRYRVTSDQAFDLLRTASQRANRKLAVIAAEVVQSGALDVASEGIED